MEGTSRAQSVKQTSNPEVVYARLDLQLFQIRYPNAGFHCKLYLSAYGSFFFFPQDTFGTPLYKILKEKTDKTLAVFAWEFFSEYMFYLQLLSINSCELFP